VPFLEHVLCASLNTFSHYFVTNLIWFTAQFCRKKQNLSVQQQSIHFLMFLYNLSTRMHRLFTCIYTEQCVESERRLERRTSELCVSRVTDHAHSHLLQPSASFVYSSQCIMHIGRLSQGEAGLGVGLTRPLQGRPRGG